MSVKVTPDPGSSRIPDEPDPAVEPGKSEQAKPRSSTRCKMLSNVDKELVCVLGLSICFFFLFTAYFTMTNMQKPVVSSIANEQTDFKLEGYTAIAISYTVFAIALWFGPYMTYALGPRLTMVIAATGYLYSIISFLTENVPLVYLGTFTVGVGAGMLWPAQGQYLIGSSSSATTARNVGIFFLIFSSSNMLGNIFVYFTFHGKKYLDQTTRRTAISFLVVLNIVAILALMMLPKSIYTLKPKEYGPFKTMKESFMILISPRMLCLVITYCYTGLQQSFWSGIYSPSIGFTLAFGDSSKELVALSGICMSIGAVLGAVCPIVFAGWIRSHRFARRMIVLCGAVAQGVTYIIACVNLPNNAVFGDTEDTSLLQPPSVALVLLGSLLLTFGDSCWTTQIYSFIGDYYRGNSAQAAALFNFVKSVLIAVSFYWCNHIGLHKQIVIMATMAVVGLIAFFVADHDNISHPLIKQEVPSSPPN